MEQLIERARGGDRRALRELLLGHRRLVESVVARFLWDKRDWEDAVQEILMRAVATVGGFEGKCRFSTWLFRVAVNQCMETNRRNSRARRKTDGGEGGVEIFSDPNASDGLNDAIGEETRRAVRDAAASLAQGMRSAFELFYVKQYSGAEAARELGITPEAFFVRLSAARARVREELQYRGIVP